MADDEFNEDDLLKQVVPARPERAVGAAPRRFKPWHKPRKQWVRRHQWFAETVKLLEQTHFPADGRIFRYLSMPGEDLLDVRILQEACVAANVELRFTGLNNVRIGSADDMQLNLSESAVRGLPTIHSGSKILREKFESIAEPESIAYAEIRGSGPFHAINIDLCDHIALREQHAGGRTIIDALAEIVQLQLAHSMQPWLLFVTTRVVPGRVDAQNLGAFIQAIRRNVTGSPEFEAKAAQLIESEGCALKSLLDSPNDLAPAVFKDLFCLGFGKWLLAYIEAAQPAREFRMLPSCFYSVHDGQPDMLSLAFRCDVIRQPPADAYGILTSAAPPEPAEEVAMAIQLAERISDLANLDAFLAEQRSMLEQMTTESEALLRAANYPVDDAEVGYRSWLAGTRPTIYA